MADELTLDASMTRRILQRLLSVGVLTLVSGLTLVTLVAGLLTGGIDGPSTGLDIVYVASQPILFWTMAVTYLIVSTATAVAAYRLARTPWS